MQTKKRLAFIVNPISGGINKTQFPQQVSANLNNELFEYDIFYTQSTEHNQKLAAQCVTNKYDGIIAVGGDGTINNTAKYVTNTDIAFGIIPLGSGNGLARHHQLIPDIKKSLQIINGFNITAIDTGTANNVFFINLTGVGFDAHVSWLFAQATKRGFVQYAKITLNEFAKYKPQLFTMQIDGVTYTEEAFIICVANGSQYGNNAFIAPTALTTDGLFEITIIKPFKLWQMPQIGLKLFNKGLPTSAQTKHYKGTHIVITRNKKDVVNIDGEPVFMDEKIDICLLPKSLNLITP